MDETPRIAVLGCGYWGRNHARTLAGLGALAAVSDRNTERAEAVAAEFAARPLAPQALIAAGDIDAVILALPPHRHAENAVALAAAGKHLLVEKPIALTVADAERVVAAAERAGIVALTGHILRYHPAFEALEALVAEGTLGAVRYIHSHRVGLGKFHAENDALWDIAPHDLSLIMAITGSAPRRVRGEGSAVLDHLSDFAHLHLEFDGGVRGHVFASRLNPYRERRLTVIGERAMAVFDDVAPWDRKLALYRHRVWHTARGWTFETAEPDYLPVVEDLPLTRECRHFIDCIAGRARPRTPLADGLAVIRILSAGTVRHEGPAAARPRPKTAGKA